jgi:prolyl-tRNA editing enzyme YbaK/EbsC (Cys-tRNA(Pro) deacylase)/ubiquinone/menaquinone biosynthesis C-methylase UbiE
VRYNSWEKGKLEHQDLADTAADDYDQKHHTTFGTGQYMHFEQAQLASCLQSLKATGTAVDIGSGTGRNSLLLSNHFQKVFGYDFSLKSVETAEKNAAEKNIGNIQFTVLDVDKKGLPHSESSVDFICAAFGMGSFFYSLGFMLGEIHRVLKPGGSFLLSFYNKNALNYLVKNFTSIEPSLAARIDPVNELLSITYNNIDYQFPVRPYSVRQVRSSIENFMDIGAIYTYPVLPTILGEEIFKSRGISELSTLIDDFMSDANSSELGAYILTLGSKSNLSKSTQHGYNKSFSQSLYFGLHDQILLHEPIKNSKDVPITDFGDVSFFTANMVKTIIIANLTERIPNLMAVCLRIEDKLDMRKLAVFVGISRSALRFASPEEINEAIGFKPGAIPPYGLGKHVPVYSDISISELSTIWCGTGSPIESIKMSVKDFRVITNTKFTALSKSGTLLV